MAIKRDIDEELRLALRLGNHLRDLRSRAELTQEDVAHRAGIAVNTYQKYESGFSKPGMPMNPTLRTLLALSSALDVDVAELLDHGGTSRKR